MRTISACRQAKHGTFVKCGVKLDTLKAPTTSVWAKAHAVGLCCKQLRNRLRNCCCTARQHYCSCTSTVELLAVCAVKVLLWCAALLVVQQSVTQALLTCYTAPTCGPEYGEHRLSCEQHSTAATYSGRSCCLSMLVDCRSGVQTITAEQLSP
jgi:hypothetical protein